MDQLRYPIGKFVIPTSFSPLEINQWIEILENLPAKLKQAVNGLNDEQLDTPYRDGGWTIRQVVHHVADSHINCYCRIKLILTEENPAIRPYFEARWAELNEAKIAPVEISLSILEAVHKRMVITLRNITIEDLDRTYYHPENKQTNPLKVLIALYAWHSKHHTAHVTELKQRKGW
ncbi:MAG: YfiT family bacillithiol transferase [Bacteroidota bacterium]